MTAVVGVFVFKERLEKIHYLGFTLVILGVCAMNT